MRIAVAGATGVLGRPVVARLLERGHRVRAIVRDASARPLRAATKLEVVRGDILDSGSLWAPLQQCDAVLHLATAIPQAGGATDWALNDRIRTEGTRNLIDAACRAGVTRYVQQSIAMLLSGPRDAIADEDAPLTGGGVLDSAIAMEAIVRETPLSWVILRGGLFYGPASGRTQQMESLAREGRLQMPGDGGDYVSLIHPADFADAVVLAAESDVAQCTLNVVDDRPVTWREVFEFVARSYGAPAPAPGGSRRLPSFRVSNARAKRDLGWMPTFPDYRTGWFVG
ncbi:MAG TPA: NAD(P)H-binding protein [Burkholderiaceae bacterium]|nr:NAD(P)H-binding protein [Burkholderiaceae bacterium]